MSTKLNDITIGRDVSFRITFQDADENEVPIVGDTIWFTAKSDIELADSSAEIHTSYAVPNDVNGNAGIAIVPIADTETANLADGITYVYAFTWITAGGQKQDVISGEFEAKISVAKDL